MAASTTTTTSTAAGDSGSLAFSSTWAVASVCSIFIICSLTIERLIFWLGQFWRSHKHFPLVDALEKIKEELMVVGFISLALTVGSSSVSKICVSKKWKNIMRQCKLPKELEEQQTEGSVCGTGDEEFMSEGSQHGLHIFIFVLAVVHVVYTVFSVALGKWKVYRWKAWEKESREKESDSIRSAEVKYTKDLTFIKRHAAGPWSNNVILSYIAAFFQQFFQSVTLTDFIALRHGFIEIHRLEQSFDFHEHIMKRLENDLKYVVGISPPLWGLMVLLLLLNVEAWGVLYWASLAPLIAVLIVGTKLRHIITQMAVSCLEKHEVIEGTIPAVKPSDDLFWFGRPRLILYLIHFILFQDAIEVSFHLWSTFILKTYNCFNQNRILLIGRLILGCLTQILCGSVVLPIYALVSQMGSKMRGDRVNPAQIELGARRVCEETDRNANLVDLQKEANEASVAAGSRPNELGHGIDVGQESMEWPVRSVIPEGDSDELPLRRMV